MPTITVTVDIALKERMARHPVINRSEVARQTIREKITIPDLMDQLTDGSDPTSDDVDDLAATIDASAHEHLEEAFQ